MASRSPAVGDIGSAFLPFRMVTLESSSSCSSPQKLLMGTHEHRLPSRSYCPAANDIATMFGDELGEAGGGSVKGETGSFDTLRAMSTSAEG